MKKTPTITCTVFEPAPRPNTGAGAIGFPATPDSVEASDQIVWSENHNALINVTANAPSL